MRKLTFFLAFALVLSLAFGAHAQTNLAIVSIDGVTNEVDATHLRAGQNHVVSVRYNLTGLTGLVGWGAGCTFEVYSPDGANWVNLVATDGPLTVALPDPQVIRYHKYYTSTNNGTSYTGLAWIPPAPLDPPFWTVEPGGRTGSVNRVAYSLACLGTGKGYSSGTNGIALTLQFSTLLADSTKTMCLDTTKASGTVAWEWAAGSLVDWPQWDNGLGVSGPRCWTIQYVPNQPPEFNAPTGNVSFNHCGEGAITLAATDFEGDAITYSFAPGYETGFGTLVGANWTWSGPTVPQAGNPDIMFLACDAGGCGAPFTLHVTTTNNAPTITCPLAKTVSINTSKTQDVVVADLDVCDTKTVTFVSFDRPFLGTYSIVGTVVTLSPVTGDESPVLLGMTVQVSDGTAADTCVVPWNVIAGAPYQVEIEKVEGQIQGQYTDVFIKLHKFDGTVAGGLGGFDFLVAYDASALAFQLAIEGEIYDECNWEYFTYRYGAEGNCGNACPSGMLRIIGIAETNNGASHPGCAPLFVENAPVILASMRFLVTNDRTLECQYVPIRFFWYNCGDNVLSNFNGSEAYLSQKVFDFTALGEPFLAGDITNMTVGFPTYQGTQAECIFEELGKVAKQNVDFQNGGVDIICSDSIDAPGDINLNGLEYEIADAVMFTNFFVNGLAAFGTHIDGSIAASDTNKDGITLSVADLVYLIRVIVGDAQPYAKISPVAARVTVGNGIFSSDLALGAAYVVVSGDVTPTLLASGMEMKYAFNGQNTNILVFSLEGNSFSGEFLEANGTVVNSEFAAFNGNPVKSLLTPSEFELHQNYPNPFNPVTTIKIDVPAKGAEWKLNVYNVTGQLVQSFSGVTSTGFETVTWDASNVSSGVYFYKLTAGDYSATKKAVLLK